MPSPQYGQRRPFIRHSAVMAGGQVHPAVVWLSLRHVCGAHASQRHTLSGDRFTPRCPVLQERLNGHRPFGHATILTQVFGSWTPSFLSVQDSQPPDMQIAREYAACVDSCTPLRVPLPKAYATASSTPGR